MDRPALVKPRVLHLITRLCVGGAQLTVFHLSRELRDRFDVHVACGPDVGDEGSIFDQVAQEFPLTLLPRLRRPLRPRDDVRVLSDLRALYQVTRPDVLHTHSSKAGIVGRLAARGMPFPVVHSVHGWGHTPADNVLKRRGFIIAERFVARHTDTLIAVSRDVRDEGIRLGIGDPRQYAVAPEYVDYAPVHPDFNAARARARRVLRLPAGAPVIGWVGRFMPQKDPATLADAAIRLLREDDRRHMIFIGDGPDRMTVERKLARAEAEERAHFAGFRDDVRSLYPAFDVLLHTSLWEGQPRVVQEAIAERVPVVAARVAGTRDLFDAGGVGFEVEPGDAAAFASQADLVLRTPALRAPLPAEAVAAVARRNGTQACLAGHLEIYQRLLNQHAGRSNRSPSMNFQAPTT